MLLARARSDPESFAEFYRRHVGRVVGFAVRRVASPGDVADVVAATFLVALESAGSYDPHRGEPVSWLIGIAARLIANQERRRVRESLAYARLEARIDAAAQAGAVSAAISGLPAGQREALLLVGEEGLSPAEAAQVLGVSSAAFRVRLARARRGIRLALRWASDLTEEMT